MLLKLCAELQVKEQLPPKGEKVGLHIYRAEADMNLFGGLKIFSTFFN
jgi:hypothetical protein